MKLLPLLAIVLFAVPSASCKSTEKADVPCRCGTPMGDLEGCAHAACAAGKTNPDNPLCVCGKLEIPESKKK